MAHHSLDDLFDEGSTSRVRGKRILLTLAVLLTLAILDHQVVMHGVFAQLTWIGKVLFFLFNGASLGALVLYWSGEDRPSSR